MRLKLRTPHPATFWRGSATSQMSWSASWNVRAGRVARCSQEPAMARSSAARAGSAAASAARRASAACRWT